MALLTAKAVALRFGFIAGCILTVSALLLAPQMTTAEGIAKYGSYGMFSMATSLSMIFFAIRRVRDKLQGGFISFSEAMRTGLLVSVIASLFYVVTWMIYFRFVDASFMDAYVAYQESQITSSDLSEAEKTEALKNAQQMITNYKQPGFQFAYTFMEVFPFAFIITALCAFLMKRKKEESN